MIENNNANVEQPIPFSNNGAETLYLTDNDRLFPPEDYTGEDDSRYEYKNDILIYHLDTQSFMPYRFILDDIEVKEGKITFFIEGEEDPITIRNKSIVRNIYPNDENSSSNKYKSFLGKKSILEHHSDNAVHSKRSYEWLNEVDTYDSGSLTECIHDGVTTFIIDDYEYDCYEYYAYEDDEIIADEDIPF